MPLWEILSLSQMQMVTRVVIVKSNGKIVTAYTNKYFDISMKNIVKQLFG